MLKKKAQGLSINTIIIAIIVLVVLVVLVMIFTGYFSGWTANVGSCETQGGECVDSCAGRTIRGVCEDETKVCCIEVGITAPTAGGAAGAGGGEPSLPKPPVIG